MPFGALWLKCLQGLGTNSENEHPMQYCFLWGFAAKEVSRDHYNQGAPHTKALTQEQQMPQAFTLWKVTCVCPSLTNEPDSLHFPSLGSNRPQPSHMAYIWQRTHCPPQGMKYSLSKKQNKTENLREYPQPRQLYMGHAQCFHRACSVRPQWVDVSRDGDTWVLTPAPRPTSLAETAARLCTRHWTHQPFRAALHSLSKAIYALMFSWCLLGFCMIWRRKIPSFHVLQPVADMYSQALALSFISWLFPKALIQTAALFSRHFFRVWLNQTNFETST